MNKLKELFIKYKEIIMYLIMGGATTVVSWGTYALAVGSMPFSDMGMKVVAANIISWVFAMLFSYITNKIWVFESHDWSGRFLVAEFGKFVSARAITGLFEIVSVPALVKLGLDQTIFGKEGMLSKIIVSIFVVLLNYVLSKIFIFKDKKES